MGTCFSLLVTEINVIMSTDCHWRSRHLLFYELMYVVYLPYGGTNPTTGFICQRSGIRILLPGIYSNQRQLQWLEHILLTMFSISRTILKKGPNPWMEACRMQSGGWRCLVRLDLYGRGFLQQMQVGLTNIEF